MISVLLMISWASQQWIMYSITMIESFLDAFKTLSRLANASKTALNFAVEEMNKQSRAAYKCSII